MADQRVARGILVANFIPGFVLCTVHGALTHSVLPAVGSVPLFFSSGLGIFLFASGRLRPQRKQKQPVLGRPGGIGEAQIGPDSDEEEASSSRVHSFWIFLADAIFAASLMVVLVFTWLTGSGGYGDAMLAAYATMPLLINFLIHAWLATREFMVGAGIADFVHYVLWRTVPPDCPHCGNRVRPESVQTPPWFRDISAPSISWRAPALSSVRIPGMSGAKGPRDWKAPAWMKGQQRQDLAPLLREDAEGSRERYHDDYDEDAVAVRTSADVPPESDPASAAEEIAVGKKDKDKGKATEATWSS